MLQSRRRLNSHVVVVNRKRHTDHIRAWLETHLRAMLSGGCIKIFSTSILTTLIDAV